MEKNLFIQTLITAKIIRKRKKKKDYFSASTFTSGGKEDHNINSSTVNCVLQM